MISSYHVSLTGQSHLNMGAGCQDCSEITEIVDGWHLVVVADGVGSAACAKEGAELAVRAIVDYCQKYFPCQRNEISLKNILLAAFNYAIKDINDIAYKNKKKPDDYDTTLSCILYDGKSLAYGHVGDGGIIGLLRSGEYIEIAKQQKADDGTSMIPLRFGANSWQFGYEEREVSSVLLATDGMYENWFAPKSLKLQEQHLYIAGLREFMDYREVSRDTNGDAEIQEKIRQLLSDDDKLGSVTSDDKTVAVIMNKDMIPSLLEDAYYQEPDWISLQEKKRQILYGERNRDISARTEKMVLTNDRVPLHKRGDTDRQAILIAGARGMLRRNLISHLENREAGINCEWENNSLESLFFRKWDMIFYFLDEENALVNWDCFFEFLNKLIKENVARILLVRFNMKNRSRLWELLCDYKNQRKIQEFNRYSGVHIEQFKFPKIFGKWCLAEEQNLVERYCSYISAGSYFENDRWHKKEKWVYVEDVVIELLDAFEGNKDQSNTKRGNVSIPEYQLNPNQWKKTIMQVRDYLRGNGKFNGRNIEFFEKVYSTYTNYVPIQQLEFLLPTFGNEEYNVIELKKQNESRICRVEILKKGMSRMEWRLSCGESISVIHGTASIMIRNKYLNTGNDVVFSEAIKKRIDIPNGYEYRFENYAEDELIVICHSMI